MTLSPAQMADALRDEAKHEFPTLEGRAMATLGEQIATLRQELERVWASRHLWFDAAQHAEATAAHEREARETAERERDAWKETAAQHCRNEAFYRDIVQQTGAHFGPEAYTSDDGSVQDSVLALKVPELAARERARAEAAEAEAEKFRTAARVLCGAHIGVPQATCPVCRAEALEAALAYIKPALPVLETMCRVAGLTAGAEKAREMREAIAALARPAAPGTEVGRG